MVQVLRQHIRDGALAVNTSQSRATANKIAKKIMEKTVTRATHAVHSRDHSPSRDRRRSRSQDRQHRHRDKSDQPHK